MTILDQSSLLLLPDHTSITITKFKEVTQLVDNAKELAVEKVDINTDRTINSFKLLDSDRESESDNDNDNHNGNDNFPPEVLETQTSSNLFQVPQSEALYWTPPVWTDSRINNSNAYIKSFNRSISEKLFNKFITLESDPKYIKLQEGRNNLPIFQSKAEILEMIDRYQIILISGETGSGKTTQIPSYILDSHILTMRGSEVNIVCTQPRRLPAISVAERVAEERCEKIGQTIGYQIRLQSEMSDSTRLLFMTTGVLLNRLQNPRYLDQVSHIIIDEVHERQIETDFLMAILRDQLTSRPNVKLILMSATLQEEELSTYFNCPIVKVSGRSHPVTDYYLEEAIRFTQQR
eukprot:gene18534-24253_t